MRARVDPPARRRRSSAREEPDELSTPLAALEEPPLSTANSVLDVLDVT